MGLWKPGNCLTLTDAILYCVLPVRVLVCWGHRTWRRYSEAVGEVKMLENMPWRTLAQSRRTKHQPRMLFSPPKAPNFSTSSLR